MSEIIKFVIVNLFIFSLIYFLDKDDINALVEAERKMKVNK